MTRFSAACLALALTAGGAQSATVLADFEGGATSNVGMLAGAMSVASIGSSTGSGACEPFSGSSGSALCGSDINGGSPTTASLIFSNIDFDTARISFDLAAAIFQTGGGGDFDNNPPNNVDLIRLRGGSSTLAEFYANPGDDQTLISVGGFTLPAGQVLTSTFSSLSVTTAGLGLGTGDLVFEFFTTNQSEHVALDNVSVEVVPLPAGLWLMLAGLGALGLASRHRTG